jgi:hypothetical protein
VVVSLGDRGLGRQLCVLSFFPIAGPVSGVHQPVFLEQAVHEEQQGAPDTGAGTGGQCCASRPFLWLVPLHVLWHGDPDQIFG